MRGSEGCSTAYDDGDEMDYHGKDSLVGEYIGLCEANSSPAPLSMETRLLQVISCRGCKTRMLLTVGAIRIAEAIMEEILCDYRIFVKEEE